MASWMRRASKNCRPDAGTSKLSFGLRTSCPKSGRLSATNWPRAGRHTWSIRAWRRQADRKWRQQAFEVIELQGYRFDSVLACLLHARIDHVCLPALGQLVADKRPDFGQLVRSPNESFDVPASGRQFFDARRIQLAIDRQTKGPRNWCGRHHQQMRVAALAHELFALGHAELVLLINDDQAEVDQAKTGREQSMSAD